MLSVCLEFAGMLVAGTWLFYLWHVYMKQAENKIKHGSATGLLLGYVYKKISLDQVNRYI